MIDEIGFLVKLRDGAQTIADAANEYLDTKSPFPDWNPLKVKWQQAEGSKGTYEKSEDANNVEFRKMHEDLQEHGGTLTREGYFYWLFRNRCTVGRKKRRNSRKAQ